jgi:peptidoglycan/LPS O-acetylase OafA/YrhL
MSNLKHREDVDGLRAVAVLAVVLFHTGASWLTGEYIGVDVFFVISGYLITGIIARELEASAFSIVAFYERRVRRIFPALFTLFFAVAVAGYVLLLPDQLRDLGKSMAPATLFLSNVFFQHELGYFSGPADLKPLLHTWSLAVEEQFYILFPPFLFITFRYFRRWAVPVVALVGLGSLALSTWAVRQHPTAAFYLATTRADELLLGSLLALGAFPAIENRAVRDALSITGLLLIAACIAGYTPQTPFPGLAAMPPCVGAALVLHSGAEGPSAAGRLLSNRVTVFIGLVSYSLYLWHWPFLVFFKYRLIREPTPAEIWLCLGAAFATSVLSWRFVEQPFRGRGAVLERWGLFGAAAAMMATMVVAGRWAASTGIPGRFGAEANAIAHVRRINEASCTDRSMDTATHPCAVGVAGASPTFAVWGDSHAEAFFPAIDHVAKGRGASGTMFTRQGCPPVALVHKFEPIYRVSDNAACTVYNAAILRTLTSTASIKNVLVIARWPYYASGIGYGVDHYNRVRMSDESGRVISSGELEEYAARTIRDLLTAGKNVYLLQTVPEFSYNAATALGRSLMYGTDPSMFDENRNAVERRGAFVGHLAQRFASETCFHFVPTRDLFCDDNVCRFRIGSAPLYSDNNHIGELANPLVEPRIASLFR